MKRKLLALLLALLMLFSAKGTLIAAGTYTYELKAEGGNSYGLYLNHSSVPLHAGSIALAVKEGELAFTPADGLITQTYVLASGSAAPAEKGMADGLSYLSFYWYYDAGADLASLGTSQKLGTLTLSGTSADTPINHIKLLPWTDTLTGQTLLQQGGSYVAEMIATTWRADSGAAEGGYYQGYYVDAVSGDNICTDIGISWHYFHPTLAAVSTTYGSTVHLQPGGIDGCEVSYAVVKKVGDSYESAAVAAIEGEVLTALKPTVDENSEFFVEMTVRRTGYAEQKVYAPLVISKKQIAIRPTRLAYYDTNPNVDLGRTITVATTLEGLQPVGTLGFSVSSGKSYISISGRTMDILAAGTAKIKVTLSAAAAQYYTLTNGTVTVIISPTVADKQPLIGEVSAATAEYGDELAPVFSPHPAQADVGDNFYLQYYASDGLTPLDEVPTSPGDYYVQAVPTGAAAEKYLPSALAPVYITNRPITITAWVYKQYDGTTEMVDYEYDGDLEFEHSYDADKDALVYGDQLRIRSWGDSEFGSRRVTKDYVEGWVDEDGLRFRGDNIDYYDITVILMTRVIEAESDCQCGDDCECEPGCNCGCPEDCPCGCGAGEGEDYHRLYMIGRAEGVFAPWGSLTRAESATMLARLTEGFSEEVFYTGATYNDVAGHWGYKYISFAAAHDIVEGYPDGSFCPDAPITRGEFTTMVCRFMEVNPMYWPSGFSDTEGHWAEAYITAMVYEEIIDGYPEGTFEPDRAISRAEAAKVVNGAIDRTPDDTVDIEALGYENLFDDVESWHWFYHEVMEATIDHYETEFH